MRTQSIDTTPEAERVQIELIRQTPITKRVALMTELSQFLIEAHKQGIRQTHPNANEKEVGLIFVANNYGQTLADKLRVYPPTTRKATPHTYHLFDALTPIVAALELLGVTYYLGGAFASAFYGILSTAIDAAPAETLQFVANLQPEHIQSFSALLANSYYINTMQYETPFNKRVSSTLSTWKQSYQSTSPSPKPAYSTRKNYAEYSYNL